MQSISIQEALDEGNEEVALHGWVYRERGSNVRKFIVLRDSSNVIQCVLQKEDFSEEEWKRIDKLSIESSVEIFGTLKKDERAPTGYEVAVKKINIIQTAEKYPITKDQSSEFLLDMRHLWVRSRRLTAVMKIRGTVMQAFREFYDKNGFVEMEPPILTPTACEGGATLFEVKYYNNKAYLTQSWQLYAEAAIFALEKIYCVSPCFRAERSKTSRHLSEFWMAEMEAAWMELPDLLKSAEECVAHIVMRVVEKNLAELELLGQDIKKLEKVKTPFPKITYTEALKILNEKEGLKIPWGKDLRTIEEDSLTKHFDRPVIVTNYPKEIMAFYKPQDPKDPKTALCFDMIAPEGYGEIIGGSQRETNVEDLKKWLRKQGEKIENYEWYFDLRKYGSIPHSGYGLGVERVVAWLCKLDNIKDAIPFPRTMLRFKP